jgi:hypothetical protein
VLQSVLLALAVGAVVGAFQFMTTSNSTKLVLKLTKVTAAITQLCSRAIKVVKTIR